MHSVVCLGYASGVRWTIPLLAVALAGCGPGIAVDERLTCGSEGPIRVLDDVAVGYATYAGDRILAHTGSSFPLDPKNLELFAVSGCGEDPSSIANLDLTAWPAYSAAGAHALQAEEDGTLAWVDTVAREPSHPLISEAASCVLSVGDGLVTQTADAAVVFHPDPASANASPTVLVEQALAPDFPYISPFNFEDCSLSGTMRPVLDGDGILVAEADGPLIRIALPSAEREVLIDGPVGEFVLLDDPRYLLWRGASASRPESDCCAIHLFDRRAGTSEQIASGLIVGDVDWEGEWLSTFSALGLPEQHETFRNYVTGESIRIDDWWDLQAPLSPTDLLVRRIGEDDPRILDVTTGVLHPLDFPPLFWPERTYDDGVVALRQSDPEDPRGDLLRLRFGSREPEVLAANIPSDWLRTQGGNLLFINRDRSNELGSLVLIEVDGHRQELATSVSAFSVPGHGTDRERNEVVYFVAEGADRGMWRLVLP